MDHHPRDVAFSRLAVFACFCTWMSYLIAYDHGYSLSAKYSSPLPGYANHLWTILQSFFLFIPGLATGCWLACHYPARAVRVGRSLMLLFLVVHVLDLVAFTYYHDRFISRTSSKLLFELSPTLIWSLNRGLVGNVVWYCMLGLVSLAAAWKMSDWVAALIIRSRYCISPVQTLVLTVIIAILCVVQPCLHWNQTIAWMKRTSDHQPVFALGLFKECSTSSKRPVGREILSSTLAAMSLAPELRQRESLYHASSVDTMPRELPDILIVIIESLRHETISTETAPNILKMANRGIWAKNHFSSGNSTNVSMFSIMYGLDSIWYEKCRNNTPALIRTARQCGYETGFFGGSTGWREFKAQLNELKLHNSSLDGGEPELRTANTQRVMR